MQTALLRRVHLLLGGPVALRTSVTDHHGNNRGKRRRNLGGNVNASLLSNKADEHGNGASDGGSSELRIKVHMITR